MKQILEWLKPGIRVKRYIFLQLLSLCVFSYALAKLFMQQIITPKYMLAYIALIIISAFTAIFSFMLAQRGVLAIALKHVATEDKNLEIKKLIATDAVLKKGPKIVLIGGGKGLANIINGLKESTSNITAIISTYDGTSSTSTINDTSDMLPAGDIRRDVIALAKDQNTMDSLLKYKFNEEYGLNVSLGSMIVTAMTKTSNGFAPAVQKMGDIFRIKGNILPVSLDSARLCAGLENGDIVVGETNIRARILESRSRIQQVFVKDTTLTAAPGVIEAIQNADVVVIGPGNLYTSVISNFLVSDVAKAVSMSKAKKVMVANLMNEPGETSCYTLAKHINEIERYIGKHVFDYLIANNGEITEDMLVDFNQGKSNPVTIDLENIQNRTVSVILEDLVVTAPNCILHDNVRVADLLMEISGKKKSGDLNLLKMKNKHKKEAKKHVINISKKNKSNEDNEKTKKFVSKIRDIKIPLALNGKKNKEEKK